MNSKLYNQICILVNEVRYSDDPRAREAGTAVGRWLRTTPEYVKAMQADGKLISAMYQKEFAALGGKARAKTLSKRRRSDIARNAVMTRWARDAKRR